MTGFDPVRELATRLGLEIVDPAPYQVALTHSSAVREGGNYQPGAADQPNERLEFLGDAILGAVVARELYARYPEDGEGLLTRRRAALIRAEQLVTWAREIGLGDFLYIGAGDLVSDNPRDRILAGAFEALVGAIALDRGDEAAAAFVHRFLDRDLDPVAGSVEGANPKGQLQELVQEVVRVTPTYAVVAESGPDHARIFEMAVLVAGHRIATGTGRSKRDAEQEAARHALALVANGEVALADITPPGVGQ